MIRRFLHIRCALATLVALCYGCRPPEQTIGFVSGSRSNLLATTLDGTTGNPWWITFRDAERGSFPLTLRLSNSGSAPLEVRVEATNIFSITPGQTVSVFSGELSRLVSNSYSLQNGISVNSSARKLDFAVALEFKDQCPQAPIRVVAHRTL